jgi:hypothetical protein
MAVKVWQTLKTQYCDHVGCTVSLEVEMIVPSEILSDQPPRLATHRCSKAQECMCMNNSTCVWAGTNPTYDPFSAQ